MNVLITGASGFIGRHLIVALAERGMHVRAVARDISSLRSGQTGEWAQVSDIQDRAGWRDVLQGIDAVVHLAARVHVMSDSGKASDAEYGRVNVEGTRALLDACCEFGVARFVFLSTIKVNGEMTVDQPFRPDDRPDPQDAYSRSKRDAENVVVDVCDESRICWTVIRPPLVYGSGVGANFARLVRLVRLGWPLPLAACQNRRSMVYVGNLCDLIAYALVDDVACGRILTVSDGEDMSVNELIRAIARAEQQPSRLFYVPRSMLSGLGSLLGIRPQIDRLVQPLEVDIGATTQILNWHPPYSVSEALKRTLDD